MRVNISYKLLANLPIEVGISIDRLSNNYQENLVFLLFPTPYLVRDTDN